MKVLFLTSEGFDTPNSINHLCETLLEDMLKAGMEVYSISSHKTGQYKDIPDSLTRYDSFSYGIIQRKDVNKNNFVVRYVDEIQYAFQARKEWKKVKKEIDAVLLQSNPNSVFSSILLKHGLKKPIVLNLYDVFPGHAMSIGVIKSRFVYNVLRVIQKILYKNCDSIIAMSEDMKDELIKEEVPENKIRVISNWFDTSAFVPIERTENKFFMKYALDPNLFYVQFAGLLGYVFDCNMYLDVATKLSSYRDIVFLLIGDGNQKEIVLGEIEKRKLHNIKYFPWQPLNIIADVYNACDIGIIPLKPGVIGNGIPSKACQLMAAKRVIVNSVESSDYTVLFDQNDMGVSITTHSSDDVAQAILELYHNPLMCERIGNNAFIYAFDHYSRQTNTAKFIKLLESFSPYLYRKNNT